MISLLARTEPMLAHALEHLHAPFALATRLYVGWVFMKSGYLKLTDWDSTLALFEYEYRVPLLPSAWAALLGTAAELGFAALVIVGLWGRISAIGLFLTNAVAVVSYAHVLLSDGFEAAIGQHYLWGYMLLWLALFGPGAWRVRWPLRMQGAPATG